MEKLSIALTNYIVKKEVISKENFDIYQYGFQSFLELILNFICSICIAVFLHMELECLLFFLLFIPLRSFNGGLHLKSYYSCLIFSCMTMTLILLIVKYFQVSTPVSFLLYFILFLFIKFTGAVNHPNRPVTEEENETFNRKTNLTLLFSLLAALYFLLFDLEKYLLLEVLIYFLVFCTLVISKLKHDDSEVLL
jgi:accessory gene regulator protein AgrB